MGDSGPRAEGSPKVPGHPYMAQWGPGSPVMHLAVTTGASVPPENAQARLAWD